MARTGWTRLPAALHRLVRGAGALGTHDAIAGRRDGRGGSASSSRSLPGNRSPAKQGDGRVVAGVARRSRAGSGATENGRTSRAGPSRERSPFPPPGRTAARLSSSTCPITRSSRPSSARTGGVPGRRRARGLQPRRIGAGVALEATRRSGRELGRLADASDGGSRLPGPRCGRRRRRGRQEREAGRAPVRRQASVVARQAPDREFPVDARGGDGRAIASREEHRAPGLVPVNDWLSRAELGVACDSRGFEWIVRDG